MSGLTRILCIDGGGVRGAIPARILVELERRLQVRTGNEDARIADFFDMIAGTSTGGLLSCLMLFPESNGRPRYSAEEALEVFVNYSSEIFSIPMFHRLLTAGGMREEKYPDSGLLRVLERCFGDKFLSDLLKPCLLTAYDIRRRQAMLFTQLDAAKRPAKDFRLVDVCRATTAAPTYFELAYIRSRTDVSYPLIDGAVFANNPTLCAYAEARRQFNVRAANMAILSLGTGDVLTPFSYSEAKSWGPIGWARPLVKIMMSGAAETIDFECATAFEAVGVRDQYLRIDIRLDRMPVDSSTEMDDARPQNLAALTELGAEAVERQSRELDDFVELLVRDDDAS